MKIKVDFLFQWAPGWSNYESVIEKLSQDRNFSCRIIVLPFHHSGQFNHDNHEAKVFLNEKGISWIWHEDYDYLSDRPDVIFIQNPYDFTRPPRFSCLALKQHNIKYAYIPYGLDVGEGDTNLTFQYNMDCHNNASWIFVRSTQHKKMYKRYCQAGNQHVYVTGHPKFDSLPLWKNDTVNKQKVLLWTPHFQEGDRIGWSTFNLYCDVMIFIAITYPIELIIRPHPLFIGRLKAFGGAAVDKFNKLLEYAKAMPNIKFDFAASYNQSFSKADALLADAGSFLLEFLPTEKPILYLTHKTCLGLNKSVKFVHDSYYIANNENDINSFVEMLIADEDPMKIKRIKSLQENLYIPLTSAADEIKDVLKHDYHKKIKQNNRLIDQQVNIDSNDVLDFFESRATDKNNSHHLVMTMYQSVELAIARDNHEKSLIIPKLQLSANSNILDIGCGNGRWYASLQDDKLFYTGIDFSPSLIAIAKNKYIQNNRCRFYVKKATDIHPELTANTGTPFTHIIISGVLLYLNDEEIVLLFQRLDKITQSGTIIYIREPIATESRLTLKEHWSEELQSQYSAIYRTSKELLSLLSLADNEFPYEEIYSGHVFPEHLNNRNETQQHYYILKKI